MEPILVSVPSSNPIKILKWKIRKGAMTRRGAILCLYETNDGSKEKLKSNDVGTVLEIYGKEGENIPPGSVVLKIQSCTHPTVMKDMCADCGADLRMELGVAGERKEPVSASVAMVHCIPELIVSEEQAIEIGREDENRLLASKKLVLLVDLDQTLIHTTNDAIPPNLKDVQHFQLWHGNSLMWYHTRIRPFTTEFLENISKLYQLHICTFGVRMYAHTIARFLDPEGKYFSHRILSRDECFSANSKTANLKALFPCGDAMVCIIDDREDVWNFAPNLIHVKPYRFFQGTADINAPPGLTKTENDSAPITHRVRRVSSSSSCVKNDETKTDPEENVKENEKGNEVISASSEQEKPKEPEKLSIKGETDEQKERNSDTKSEVQKVERTSEKIGEGMNEENDACIENTNQFKLSQDIGDTPVTDTGKDNNEQKDCNSDSEIEEIEWDDDDDYLFYLQDILTRIHKAFYDMHDELTTVNRKPDLRNIIPYVKRKCLKGLNILFSGVIPTNMPPEKSRAFNAAKALGASIQTKFVPKTSEGTDHTTHVIGAHMGTVKVRQALKAKNVKIVNLNWLWSCLDRWEKVEESLFPIAKVPQFRESSPDISGQLNQNIETRNGKRKIGPKNESTLTLENSNKKAKTDDSVSFQESDSEPKGDGDEFKSSFNPLYMFSDDDLANMDKEVEDLMEDGYASEDDSSVENDDERDFRLRQQVLSSSPSVDSSSDDNLDGEPPKGFNRNKKRRSRSRSNTSSEKNSPVQLEEEGETENELEKFEKTVNAFAPESDSESTGQSIGSADEEIAEAIEREFLF